MDKWQHTIKKSVSFAGIGLHSGKTVKLVVKPAEANTGIRFVRTDLAEKVVIPAILSRVSNTVLATTLAKDGAEVSTTEHLLAALSGVGIDNAIVELDNDEVPIMDGSASPFVHVLQRTGRQRQKSKRLMLKITKPLEIRNGESALRIEPCNGFKVSGEIDFDHHLIRKQTFSVTVDSSTFVKEVASARTFGFLHEVEYLRSNGKALGGSLENAIVIDRNEILNTGGLRFSDEFVRHKILDLIGDLALLGFPILGHVKAVKSGHAQHLELMKEIVDHPECWQLVKIAGTGDENVLEKVVMSTMAAGNKILPYLVPPRVMSSAGGVPVPF
ncbi:MAG: UDP-3-O-[3-hydroxymyristoyl] N-acetylglucosamine deacetylase [Desulfobulbaceae bacterium DB1]|nr:MAG: UDP-3-O-[3-hydroxymyristoyl] N-acetylglucosamine deacetylase [Desulfobulbaceae bacterium DB1]